MGLSLGVVVVSLQRCPVFKLFVRDDLMTATPEDSAATACNERRFRSPNRILARSFRLARDKWKQKYMKVRAELKNARHNPHPFHTMDTARPQYVYVLPHKDLHFPPVSFCPIQTWRCLRGQSPCTEKGNLSRPLARQAPLSCPCPGVPWQRPLSVEIATVQIPTKNGLRRRSSEYPASY